jgi:uncharacterized protein (TIGR03067 family)
MKKDLDLLQGTWNIRELEADGQAMPAAMLQSAQIVIQGNRFTSTGMGAVYEGTIELDASANPPHITMNFDAGPEKGNTNPGIYKLDRSKLRICLATRGSVRPSKFAAGPGTGFALETLVRGKAPSRAEKPAPKKRAGGPKTEFEGEWRMISGVMDGTVMKESDVQWVKRLTSGNEVVIQAGPQTLMKMTFTNDASKSPQTMDYVHIAGAHKGKTQEAIYKLEGSRLTVCAAAPGSSRPKTFESNRGDGRSLTVWDRNSGTVA